MWIQFQCSHAMVWMDCKRYWVVSPEVAFSSRNPSQLSLEGLDHQTLLPVWWVFLWEFLLWLIVKKILPRWQKDPTQVKNVSEMDELLRFIQSPGGHGGWWFIAVWCKMYEAYNTANLVLWTACFIFHICQLDVFPENYIRLERKYSKGWWEIDSSAIGLCKRECKEFQIIDFCKSELFLSLYLSAA